MHQKRLKRDILYKQTLEAILLQYYANSGTKNMHKARTGIPIRITAIFKNSVVPRFIKSTSLIYC